MGVPGLWDLLRPAATRTSLSTLAREAFHANKNGLRALTIGIDASIWIFHAQVPQYGENPFLRTIFFKITSLLQQPVLPVFVFDGPNKPARKRGERVAGHFGTSDYRSKQFKELLDACGLEWWNAPGEAEAELALMSRQGKIDAVLSDDVDALLFGATCLLRNNSPTLSGAQASSTQNSVRSDLRHYEMYRASAIVKQWTDREGTKLKTEEDCRMAMVWIALLGGGDYAPEGLPGFGPTITYALANAGIADFLHQHKSGTIDRTDAQRVVSLMMEELKTNATGHLGRRYPDRAKKLSSIDPSSIFPTSALDAYLRPATSSTTSLQDGWPGFGKGEPVFQKRGKARNEGRGDLTGFAKACERFFEWGTKDLVAKKFASESVGLFGSELVMCARERVRLRDPPRPLSTTNTAKCVDGDAVGPASRITGYFQSTSAPSRRSPSSPPRRQSFTRLPSHVTKIHAIRKDPTNNDLNEYRVSFVTSTFVARCHAEMDGHRVDPKDLDADVRAELGLREAEEPSASQAVGDTQQTKSEARVWMAEYLVKDAWPELVEVYETELEAKAAAKSKPKRMAVTQKKSKTKATGVDTEAFKSFFVPSQRPSKQAQQRSSSPVSSEAEEEEILEYLPPRSSSGSRTSKSSTLSPPPPVPTQRAVPKRNARRAPTPSSSSSTSGRPPSSAQPRHASPDVVSKAASPHRTVRRSTRATQKSKKSGTIIDLCSSDDEPSPKPVRSEDVITSPRPALAAITKSNTPPARTSPKPTSSVKDKDGKGKGKSRETSSQTLLALPVVRPMQTPPTKSVPAMRQKAPLFVVTYEDEQTVELDVRGRWARGESVGLWEDVE